MNGWTDAKHKKVPAKHQNAAMKTKLQIEYGEEEEEERPPLLLTSVETKAGRRKGKKK